MQGLREKFQLGFTPHINQDNELQLKDSREIKSEIDNEDRGDSASDDDQFDLIPIKEKFAEKESPKLLNLRKRDEKGTIKNEERVNKIVAEIAQNQIANQGRKKKKEIKVLRTRKSQN